MHIKINWRAIIRYGMCSSSFFQPKTQKKPYKHPFTIWLVCVFSLPISAVAPNKSLFYSKDSYFVNTILSLSWGIYYMTSSWSSEVVSCPDYFGNSSQPAAFCPSLLSHRLSWLTVISGCPPRQYSSISIKTAPLIVWIPAHLQGHPTRRSL